MIIKLMKAFTQSTVIALLLMTVQLPVAHTSSAQTEQQAEDEKLIKKPICFASPDGTYFFIYGKRSGEYVFVAPRFQINLHSKVKIVRDESCMIFLYENNPAYTLMVAYDQCAHVAQVSLVILFSGAVHSFVDPAANVIPCAQS